jgi:peptidoglycan/xylan/chitin deacetylase (PgdA/CDA1 family)
MKKLKRIVLFLGIFSLLISTSFADSAKTIRLKMYSKTAYVNNQAVSLDVPPVEIQGRTMVPIRFISEQMGIKDIVYQAKTREVILKFQDPQTIDQEMGLLEISNHQMAEQNKNLMKRIWDLKFPRTLLTSVNEMESNFTDFYKSGYFEYNQTDFKSGTGSLFVKAYPENVPCGVKTDLPLSDFTKKSFRFYVKSPRWDDLSNFSIAFGTDNGWSDYFVLDLKSYLRFPPDNEWMEIILSKSDFKAFGSPSWDSVTSLLIRTSAKTALPAIAMIDGFSMFTDSGFGCVSLCFDRGQKSVIANALPLMKQYKYTGNLFLTPDTIGSNGYMNQEDITLLHYLGWNIGGQAKGNLFYLSDQDLKNQLTKTSSYLLEKGYRGSRNFALPYGGYNKRIQDTIRSYFSTIRLNDSLNQPKDFILPERINSQIVTAGTTFENLQQWINTALINGDWLVLVFYGVEPVPLIDTDCRLENFRKALDYINQFKIPVKTFDEALYY